MARLEYFIVSESVALDQATNRVSFFHVFEEIHTRAFPVLIPQLVAISGWNAEEGDAERDFQALLRVRFPDGTSREFRQNFRLPGRRHRVMLTLEGVAISRVGQLRLEVELNGVHAADHLIDVLQDLPVA